MDNDSIVIIIIIIITTNYASVAIKNTHNLEQNIIRYINGSRQIIYKHRLGPTMENLITCEVIILLSANCKRFKGLTAKSGFCRFWKLSGK